MYYPYTDWMDSLKFVLKGSYGGVFATYDHDDNYNSDGYYPLEADTPYILTGKQKPYHIHLTRNLLDAWVFGNLTAAAVVAATFVGDYVVGDLIQKGLAAISKKVAAILAAPEVVAILLIWSIVDALHTLLEILGFLSEAQWVESVLRERFLGDGWAWRGRISSGEFIGWYWSPYIFKPMLGIGIYEFREFKKTWGAEGIFGSNPHEYSICWYNRTEWLTASTVACLPHGYPGPCGVK